MSYNVMKAGGVLVGAVEAPETIKTDFPAAFDEGTVYYIDEASPVYKRRANGSIDKMSFWFYYKDDTWYIRTIIENNKGAETREYNSVVKEVNSKVYFRVCLERLLAKRTKKLDRDGWSLETSGEGPLKEPMLLHKWEDYKDTVVYPLILQPKLNGVRATWCPSQEELFSRKRTKLVLPHIRAELRGQRGVDAEIWHPEMSFEDISGAVRSGDHSDLRKEMLEAWLIDKFGDGAYCLRLKELISGFKGEHGRIKVIPSIIVHNEGEVDTWFERIMKERGVDGVVLRDPGAPYRWDHRSTKALKKKALLSAEYPIIGTSAVADPPYPVGLITFIVAVGEQELEVIPNWSKERRAAAIPFRKKYIGKPLTLEFREYTSSGLPKHIVSVEVRDYEG